MHVITWISTGSLAGAIAYLLGWRRMGMATNVILGAFGGALGGASFRWLGVTEPKPGLAHVLVSGGAAIAGLLVVKALWRATNAAARHVRDRGTPAPGLEGQIARLDEAERRVVSKLLRREPVARDASAEFAEHLGFGDRVADRVASFGGSWAFLGIFGTVMLGWIAWNGEAGPQGFDPYPFILLNLVLSCVAAVQAPVIMMSQNRMAARDRADARLDYEVNLKAEMEILSLHDKLDSHRDELWKQALTMLEQQRRSIERLERRVAGDAPGAEPDR